MRVVIDIPNSFYDRIINDNWNTTIAGFACYSIADGLPLPAEHDDLITRESARMCLTGDITNISLDDYIARTDKRLKELPAVVPADETRRRHTMPNSDSLKELPQYHFDREAFVKAFEEVFSDVDLIDIEMACQARRSSSDFLMYYTTDEEYYIIHFPSGTVINWYKHLGRTNTCNKAEFTIDDLKEMLELLKAEMNFND